MPVICTAFFSVMRYIDKIIEGYSREETQRRISVHIRNWLSQLKVTAETAEYLEDMTKKVDWDDANERQELACLMEYHSGRSSPTEDVYWPEFVGLDSTWPYHSWWISQLELVLLLSMF